METVEEYTRPVTLGDLHLAWANRDDQYARRLQALTPEEIEGVRIGRSTEVDFLPPEDRAKGWGEAVSWYPPEHAQGRR